MKRIITLAISLVVVICSCTSCFTMMAVAAASGSSRSSNLGHSSFHTTAKTFQRIAGPAALATTTNGDIICIIADFGEYYDGLTVKGKFYKKGTYSYVTTSGANRTVLVYLYGPDRKKLESYTEQFLKETQKIVVDESQLREPETTYRPI